MKNKNHEYAMGPVVTAHFIIITASLLLSLSFYTLVFGLLFTKAPFTWLFIMATAALIYYCALVFPESGKQSGPDRLFKTAAVLTAVCSIFVCGVKIFYTSLVAGEISGFYKSAGASLELYKNMGVCREGAELYARLEASQKTGSPAAVSYMPAGESFHYFIQKKWGQAEMKIIGAAALQWEPLSGALAKNILRDGCLGLVNYNRDSGDIERDRKKTEILEMLDDEAAKLAMLAKYYALNSEPSTAYQYAQGMLGLLKLLKEDKSGFASKRAAISVSRSINSLIGALSPVLKDQKQLAEFASDYAEVTSADLPGMGLVDETYAATRLWKPSKTAVRINPLLDAMAVITGASDISYYMVLHQYRRFIKEGTKFALFDFNRAASWPYMYASGLPVGYVKLVKTERILKTEKHITTLGLKAGQYRLKYGRFPENIDILAGDGDKSAIIDAFRPEKPLNTSFLKGIYTIYSVGIDKTDDLGDLKSLSDIGIMLY
ncbi:MAG: hypothetical protein LLG37_02155 [Spirochaetia bacterium]|nr:hypothetical protein [Spirochaetia bacterium]